MFNALKKELLPKETKNALFPLFFAHLFVPLDKVLSLERAKKIELSFCFMLTYSYLCNEI